MKVRDIVADLAIMPSWWKGERSAIPVRFHDRLLDDDPIALVNLSFQNVERRRLAMAEFYQDPPEGPKLVLVGLLRFELGYLRGDSRRFELPRTLLSNRSRTVAALYVERF